MKKNIALLLSLTLGLTVVCAIPALPARAESSKELIVSETPTGSGETDTTGTEAITMYRLYNPNSGEHFYTKDESEKDGLVKEGWNDEGMGWIAPVTSKTPVYRLYNPNAGDHHYTMNEKERDGLIVAGWNDEGIGWYSDDAETVPLYREYNPNAVTGTHNYTTDKAEHDGLVAAGWHDEGIGWYAIGDGKNDPPKKPDDDSLEIGDIVILGTYEQDNDPTNGPEPIEWQYIGDRDGHKMLLSKYALDAGPFNDKQEEVNWEGCTLRKWLNEDFYNTAFSIADKEKIVIAHNEDPDTYELYKPCNYADYIYGVEGGNPTDDNVFLLSWVEARDYFDGMALIYDDVDVNQNLLCKPTVYAEERGAMTYKGDDYDIPLNTYCRWWLRSPGDRDKDIFVSAVYPCGAISRLSMDFEAVGVRPALLID